MTDLMRRIQDELLPWLRDGALQTDRAARQQLSVWSGHAIRPPLLLRVTDARQATFLRGFNPQETHYDAEKMLLDQLRGAVAARAGGAGAVPSVRANMGCGIYAAFFGITQDLYPDKMPWVRQHLSAGDILSLTRGDMRIGGDFAVALETMRSMRTALSGTGVALYPLDLQGIVDLAHLVAGDDFFYWLYDDPDLIHHLMTLCETALIEGARAVYGIIDPQDGWAAHYGDLVLPSDRPLKVSEDTTTLLSRAHIGAYAVRHTAPLLEAFGGGYMHFCGKNPALIDWALADPRWIGLNLGNPEMHDIEAVLRRLAASGKVYYGALRDMPSVPRRERYRRLIEASRDEHGCARLLLVESCSSSARDDVLSDWIAAGGEAEPLPI